MGAQEKLILIQMSFEESIRHFDIVIFTYLPTLFQFCNVFYFTGMLIL